MNKGDYPFMRVIRDSFEHELGPGAMRVELLPDGTLIKWKNKKPNEVVSASTSQISFQGKRKE